MPRDGVLPRGAVEGRRLRAPGLAVGLATADLLGMLALGLLVFAWHGMPRGYDPHQLFVGTKLFLLSWLAAAQLQRLYRREALFDARGQVRRAVGAWAIAFGALLFLAFSLKLVGGFSRGWVLGWGAASLLWLVALRAAWGARLRHLARVGWHTERVVVVAGARAAADRLAEALAAGRGGGVRPVLVVAAFADADLPGGVAGTAFLQALPGLLREAEADRVCIAQRGLEGARLVPLLECLGAQAVDVSVLPDLSGLPLGPVRAGMLGGLAAVDVAVRPLSDGQAMLKRAEDVVLSAALLVLLAPVMALTALAVRLDSPGPVLFRQRRVGFRGEGFSVLKFRSMRAVPAAEGRLEQTRRDDPRVTRVGRVIRRTSLDELPQLLNVLRGEMSLVGPRPHAPGMTAGERPLDEVAQAYARRHRMRPGMTGWAQVNGHRGPVESEAGLRARLSHDLDYIERWSVWLDLRILLRTAAIVLFDRRAF
jgi:exopolysaccharide biosynthesis polyprenyl glycosylphosphotransferase